MKTKNSPDFLLMSVVLILMGLGLVTIYSSSAIYALDRFGSSTYFFWRQLIWILISLCVGSFFIFYDHRRLRFWVNPLLLISLILLILVLVIGKEAGGAKRWIRIGEIGFQPSELVKLVLILFVAHYLDRKKSKIKDFKNGLLPLCVVVALFCSLIFIQPDLGTPVLIAFTFLTMIFFGGVRKSHLASLTLSILILALLAIWSEPYRWKRVLAFLNPWENSLGSSYQLIQSLLALGSGGLTGVGLGGSHSKLLYIPEPHTDFIFPVYAEEFGLIGSWFILILFGLIAWSGFRIATRSSNLFSSLVASGVTVMILYQAIFNIAIVTGCLPTKGVSLPFLSFGGSSLVVMMVGIGMILNISKVRER